MPAIPFNKVGTTKDWESCGMLKKHLFGKKHSSPNTRQTKAINNIQKRCLLHGPELISHKLAQSVKECDESTLWK